MQNLSLFYHLKNAAVPGQNCRIKASEINSNALN